MDLFSACLKNREAPAAKGSTSHEKARMTHTRRHPGWLALLLALGASIALPLHADPIDVRVLVDVSGSMKRTDPRNLRVPALRLLGQLLPEGTRAAAWLFCENVEPLLPPARVDAKWKQAARESAARIHSRGQFTDIERAIRTAIANWPDDPKTKRHLILLTDGMVDVAKDPAVSAASKARLEDEVLATLKAQGIRIHTIALSAEADHALLGKLAAATDGWSEQVTDAAGLERVFLHMFEQTAAPDSLPIEGNAFTVDPSVRELTVLVFHAGPAAPLELRDPAGKSITGKALPEYVHWQAEAGYDLVTIAAPAPGKWTLNAKEDRDNRVLIVSDLALTLDAPPASAIAGDGFAIRARLTDKEQPITRRDFLALVKGEVTLAGQGPPSSLPLALDAAEPAFTATAGTALGAGDYDLTIKLDGGTFSREKHHHLRVLGMPAAIAATARKTAAGADLDIAIDLDSGVVRPETLAGLVVLDGPDGAHDALELPPPAGGRTALRVPVTRGGDWRIVPWLLVETATGRTLRLKPAPLRVTADIPPPQPVTGAPPPVPPPPPPRKIALGPTALLVGAGNAGLGALLGGVWFVLRRRQQHLEQVTLA